MLITIQIAAIGCSALLIVLDFMGYYILKSFIHSFVYAFKLQLEFVILNELRRLVTQANSGAGTIETDLTLFSLLKKKDMSAGGRNEETDMEIHPV